MAEITESRACIDLDQGHVDADHSTDVPVFNKVKRVLKPPRGRFWVTMYDQLSDEGRRQKIAAVCSTAPAEVSLLRRIDVALWMHATQG